MSDARNERIAELERAVADDPAADGFAALAELHRRAGQLEAAERIVTRGLAEAPDSLDGRAVLALILADAGRDTDLRRTLEKWAERAVATARAAESAGESLSLCEIDRAFDAAEPDVDEMITPDTVAEEAALRADGPLALENPLEWGGAFATRTMADLLERQGDHEGAARIRARLGEAATGSPASGRPEPDSETSAPDANPQVMATIAVLERWLQNARRMQA